jgi:hypothetical protein
MTPVPVKTRVPTGQIDIQVRSESWFLGQVLPIEVRDGHLRLVARLERERTLDLPEGLYEVSAVLEDGRKYSTLVQVKGGKRTPVELKPEEESKTLVSMAEAADSNVPRYRGPHYTRSTAALAEIETAGEAVSDANLLEVRGATLVRQTRTLWIFQCEPFVNVVPSALYRIDGRRLQISLPVSSDGGSPSASCVVRVERTSAGVHAHAWIAPERTVANALQNMLTSGYVLEAARVADDAVELLRAKYDDPAGAALGALLLYKVGRLQRWQSWVENLARDFPWLPDGKVLLAQILYDQEPATDAALRLALGASEQRMLYAENYSLCLDLLRRWPLEKMRKEARDAWQIAVDHLADAATDIDWDSVCLSQWVAGENE